jgi:radical SAM superfamily enzyme YgiQ (UPF0313 family)
MTIKRRPSILFLNLPNKEKIQRRYMCSYNTPTFLFQPLELIALAAIARDWKNYEVNLIDAIAEGKDFDAVSTFIEQNQPEIIVSISGFECFEEDMEEIKAVKSQYPKIKFVLFGHYASEFPKEIMLQTNIDFIIHGEPDIVFSDLLDAINGKKDFAEISGLSYRNGAEVIHQFGAKRIPNPNELPMPAYDLLKNEYYGEPFFPKPYGLIQSARGCPYQCNYCVKSFGTKLTALTAENTILHLERYIALFQIQSFRFIDDTFTAVPKRVIEFCKLMIEKGYQNLPWSALSRPDTMDLEMLKWMKKAGCTRLYIGMESGSQKVLDFYNKNVDVAVSMANIKAAKDLGFEIMGFFMVGAPNETQKEVEESINFSIQAGFDFITVGELIPYPGTSLYDKMKSELNFSLIPYKNEFIRNEQEKRVYQFQKLFFKRFYFRPAFIANLFSNYFFKYTTSIIETAINFVRYLFLDTFKRNRKDYI